MTKIRDEVRQLLHDEISSWDEQGITYRRQNLNYLYDRFISQYGFINSRENRSAFSEDPDYPLLLSLEIYDEEKKKATKADIFKTRVIHPNKKITHVDSVKEAFLVTLNELGKVNFARMSELCGKSEDELITELGGLIYKNPEGDKWETADAYLSGDVRKKLRAAQSAAIIDPSYAKNIDALRAVQPEDLKFDEIYVNLGTPWIPGTDIEKFIEHILGQKYEIRASYSPVIGTWAVQIKDSDKYSVQTNVNNTKKWGTSRYSAVELIDDALNHRIPTVTDWNALKEKYVINEKETEAAREKQHLIKDTFKEWLWSDRERRERLTASYNENYNNIRPQTFDGSHLTLPGKTANITMMKSQLDAIWRIIQTGNTLLGHLVGAGKTYIQIAAAMEMKRLGLAAKPIIIVPNNLLEQWAAEFLRLYPLANVLAAGKKDFTPVKRKTLMSRIATGNWDAILVTHSSFEKLPMSNEAYIDHIQKQIDELEDAIYSFGSEKSKQTKELEKAKKRLETKIKLRLKEHKKDDCLTFEELGIDMIEVDEADLFKNLFFVTKMTRVAGLPNTESNRAYDLFIKVSWLNNRDLTTVFATGTPVSNTMAEMYTMKRYLAPKLLRKYGLEHFDAWAHMFGEVVTTLEIAPDGSGYRLRSRFARFINLPELQQIFWSFADIQTDETLTLDKPQIEGGKPYIIKAPASPELTKYVQSLIKRAEKLRKGGVDPREDNMLNITTDGRKAALDMRVVSRREKDFEHSKINKAVAIIYEEYKRTENNRGTQLFFCDLSTPNDRAFNVYDDIRAKLVRLGVPKEEIAYIHEADTDDKLKRLYSKVNAGSIRILMGSTTKMGAGMNVQRLLSSIHHLDCPWRPRDIEQREGRILRPGNENKTVRIYRYVTEGSFDAYMWQTVEAKARFIAQIMTKKISVRCAEDVDNRILTYAELKVIASGNPLVKEKFEIDIELRRLMTLKSQHQAEKYRMENDLVLLPERIERAKTRLLQYQNDLAARKIPADFKITIEGNTYGEREAAGNKIISLGLALRGMDSYTKVGAFAGFDLYIKTHQYAHLAPSIIARGEAEHIGTVSESAFGTIQSLEYNVKNIEQKIKEYSADIEDMSNNLTKLKEEMDKPFPYEEKIQKLLLRQVKIDKLLDLDKRELTGGLAANEQSNAAAA